MVKTSASPFFMNNISPICGTLNLYCWRKGENDDTKNGLKNDWNSMDINSNDGKAVKKANRIKGKQGERKLTG